MSRILTILMIGGALSACSLIPSPGEPTKKYTLSAVAGEPNGQKFLPHQLIVDLPTLYPPIDNTRIALKPEAQTIDYYADVEWADRLSVLIQESLIYSLQNKGVLRGVSRPTEGVHANYALKVEVRKFYVKPQKTETKTAVAQVNYMIHLVKLPERHIVASRNFTHTQTIPDQTMESIIKSLNTAHLEASKALVPWVVSQMR